MNKKGFSRLSIGVGILVFIGAYIVFMFISGGDPVSTFFAALIVGGVAFVCLKIIQWIIDGFSKDEKESDKT